MFQPGQQTIGGRANDIGLREVVVHVDKARGDDATWQVFDRNLREALPQILIRSHCLHPLRAVGIGSDHEQTVVLVDRRARRFTRRVKTQDGGAVSFHEHQG